jgi:D-lactate dehydrogenase
MKVAMFSVKSYDKDSFVSANTNNEHEFHYFEAHLNASTAALAKGCQAVCAFVNDTLDQPVLQILAQQGTTVVALRCAGYNNVDLNAAHQLGIKVVRVPAYSPHAVAEHAVALMMALNRKTHKAYNRVREGNFSLDGLIGFDMYQKTVGVIGTGKIGVEVARILKGFGCHVLAYDPYPNPQCKEMGVNYTDLQELCQKSDIITLHCPLTPETHHLINDEKIALMKPGVMLVNTSRGAILDTNAVVAALKSARIGYFGIDVYEEEGDLFFKDLSCQIIQDDVFTRLLTFPNVIVTGHQAFLTHEALKNIAEITLQNITEIESNTPCPNELKMEANLLVSA